MEATGGENGAKKKIQQNLPTCNDGGFAAFFGDVNAHFDFRIDCDGRGDRLNLLRQQLRAPSDSAAGQLSAFYQT